MTKKQAQAVYGPDYRPGLEDDKHRLVGDSSGPVNLPTDTAEVEAILYRNAPNQRKLVLRQMEVDNHLSEEEIKAIREREAKRQRAQDKPGA